MKIYLVLSSVTAEICASESHAFRLPYFVVHFLHLLDSTFLRTFFLMGSTANVHCVLVVP